MKISLFLLLTLLFSCTKKKEIIDRGLSEKAGPKLALEDEKDEDCADADPDEIAKKIREASDEPSFSLTEKTADEGCTIDEN